MEFVFVGYGMSKSNCLLDHSLLAMIWVNYHIL